MLRLPTNPAEIPVELEGDNADYNVLAIGPITAPRIPKQKQITLSGYLPGKPDPFTLTTGGFIEPEVYIQFFEKAMYDRATILYTPVRYYEDGTPFATQDSGFDVLVDHFTATEKGGETGDFYYELSLIEYRDYSPQSVEIKKPDVPSAPVKAEVNPTRPIPQGKLCVGATVIVNGPFYYSSYQNEPHGTASGKRCKVSRIITDDPSRACPIHITAESGGALGWVKKDAVQVVAEP